MNTAICTNDFQVSDNRDWMTRFIRQATATPMLTQEEERDLAHQYQRNNDLNAAHRLVQAYLRLVLRIAREYRNYHLQLADLVQEGTIGLMLAVKKFDPDRGVRLVSYATWWIRAAIQEFILNTVNTVKIATTQIKRRLFFKLRQAKESSASLTHADAEELAQTFSTDVHTILEMDSRMGADMSLNVDVEGGDTVIDVLPDPCPDAEHTLMDKNRQQGIYDLVHHGLSGLSDREKFVITQRYMLDKQATLATLATHFNISRERVRQIEQAALKKLRKVFSDKQMTYFSC